MRVAAMVTGGFGALVPPREPGCIDLRDNHVTGFMDLRALDSDKPLIDHFLKWHHS